LLNYKIIYPKTVKKENICYITKINATAVSKNVKAVLIVVVHMVKIVFPNVKHALPVVMPA
jgi:hypothetical protein